MIVWVLLVLAMAALMLSKRIDDRRAHARVRAEDERA